jgi:hypothetical protein
MCHEQGRLLRDHFHAERVKEAEHLASMTRNALLDDRQRANLLLHVRDELDVADKLPSHARRQRRQEILDRARSEYGAAFDDEALPAIEAADREWHEPNLAETDVIKQLSIQANQNMQGVS